jgi:hypothetical protein
MLGKRTRAREKYKEKFIPLLGNSETGKTWTIQSVTRESGTFQKA